MSDLLTVTVQSDGIDSLFRDLGALVGKPAGRMIRERAGMLGRYFASATQPVADEEASANDSAVASFVSGSAKTVGVAISESTKTFTGDSKHARELGRAAVRRDIRYVYIGPATTYKYLVNEHGLKEARAFYALMKAGDYGAASQFLQKLGLAAGRLDIIGWDDGARHQRMRDSRGRISKRKAPAMVPNVALLRSYIAKIAKRVGWAKSGWITAAKMIPNAKGFSGLAAWMKLPAPGKGFDRTEGDDPSITLINNVRYLEVPAKYISGAQDNFEENLRKEIQIVSDKIAQKNAL